MSLTFHTIARNLNVATSTVHRIFNQFEFNGDVAARPLSHRPEIRLLDERCELFVIGLILESPTLHEVRQQIQEITSLSVSQATICRLLQRYDLTHKKVKQVALQRCYVLRRAREQLICLMKRAPVKNNTFVDLAMQSVIIMDSCSVQEVKQLLNQAGILALPPYCPGLKSIEPFNYVKSYLRKHVLLQSGAPLLNRC
jgi:transposase